MRASRVEVDLAAIGRNVSALRALAGPARFCAVVKADGYGHGDVPVAEAALAAGADWLAVALVEEGVRLREAGVTAPILLLSQPAEGDAGELVGWNLTPTVYTVSFARALAGAGGAPVHVKVDTGMHRVGAEAEELDALLAEAARLGLTVEGLWTHFAVAEDDPAYTELQIARFEAATRAYPVPISHLANTAGTILHPSARRDMVRCGIGIYGIHPGLATRTLVDLDPAMRIASEVSLVRRLGAGERPSYGRIRPLPADAKVATVPIGYADGVPRNLAARAGEVLIRGRRYPLAGNVTMDQLMVDLATDPVEVGDEVVLIGRQGEAEVTVDEWAERMGTISWEIVSRIGPRLPRRYLP
jgi:alanine racemase